MLLLCKETHRDLRDHDAVLILGDTGNLTQSEGSVVDLIMIFVSNTLCYKRRGGSHRENNRKKNRYEF